MAVLPGPCSDPYMHVCTQPVLQQQPSQSYHRTAACNNSILRGGSFFAMVDGKRHLLRWAGSKRRWSHFTCPSRSHQLHSTFQMAALVHVSSFFYRSSTARQNSMASTSHVDGRDCGSNFVRARSRPWLPKILQELLHVHSNSLLFLHHSSTARTLRTVGCARLALAEGWRRERKSLRWLCYWKRMKKKGALH